MSKNHDTDIEQISDVFVYLHESYSDLDRQLTKESDDLDRLLERSSTFLREHGASNGAFELLSEDNSSGKEPLIIPTWDSVVSISREAIGAGHKLDVLFTKDELKTQRRVIHDLNESYKAVHRLDETDIAICSLAGLLSAAVDMLLVGVPERSKTGLIGGPLENYVRDYFDRLYPPEEMEKLARQQIAKVPFDVVDRNKLQIDIEGLSAYYHRLLSLGHDPLLGYVFGVADILSGKITTIDKLGRFVSQEVEGAANKKACTVFAALCKETIHLQTDITTSMGLPAPCMAVFNLMQFGSFGEDNQTIAEIVQGMYYQGYDFIHFCAQSIPVILTEVIVRLCYSLKRIHKGYSVKESIPFSLDREKHPKLATMLFLAHSIASGVDTGRVYFSKNPMEINYPQWIAFAFYSYKQVRWVLLEKPAKQHEYVMKPIEDELLQLIEGINETVDTQNQIICL